MDVDKNSRGSLPRIPILLFIMAYFYHLSVIWVSAVDVPWMDEWEAISGYRQFNLASEEWWRYLFFHHLETRMLFTNLQTKLLHLINGWDNRFHVLIPYLVWGMILGTFYKLFRKNCETKHFWPFFLGMFCLLSPRFWEAHAWGQQSHNHYSILFLIWGVLGLLDRESSLVKFLCSTLFLGFSIFSFSRGVASTLVFVPLAGLFYFLRYRELANPKFIWRGGIVVLFISICYLVNFGVFLLEPLPRPHAGLTMPWTIEFWDYYLNLTALIFGYKPLNALVGAVSIALCVGPIYVLISEKKFDLSKISDHQWQLLSLIIVWLGTLGAVAMGRASFPVETSKLSRYAFASGLILPVVMILYLQSSNWRKVKVVSFILALWVVGNYQQSWPQTPYQTLSQSKEDGLACLQKFLKEGKGGEILCKQLYPWNIRNQVEIAKKLNLSFTRLKETTDPREL